MSVLSHTWVASGKLAGKAEFARARVGVVLHGLMGSGRNWMGPAKALVARRPDVKVLLVDLRGHGRSGTVAEPPHDLDACAADLEATVAEATARRNWRPPDQRPFSQAAVSLRVRGFDDSSRRGGLDRRWGPTPHVLEDKTSYALETLHWKKKKKKKLEKNSNNVSQQHVLRWPHISSSTSAPRRDEAKAPTRSPRHNTAWEKRGRLRQRPPTQRPWTRAARCPSSAATPLAARSPSPTPHRYKQRPPSNLRLKKKKKSQESSRSKARRVAAGLRPPTRTVLVDSVPGLKTLAAAKDGVGAVLATLEASARLEPFESRPACAAALEAAGLAPPTALWLASSVEKQEGGWRYQYDLAALRALYDAYGTTDLWHVAHDLADQRALDLIIAGRNPHPWDSPATRDHLADLDAKGALRNAPDAGHNVHVDDLPTVLAALEDALSLEPPSS